MTGRTRLAGEAVVEPRSESAEACNSDFKKEQDGLVNSRRRGVVGPDGPATGDAPDSRAIVTVCMMVRTTGQISFEISTSLVSG